MCLFVQMHVEYSMDDASAICGSSVLCAFFINLLPYVVCFGIQGQLGSLSRLFK